MSKKKVLGIFAHPDDEILFGFPIFQDNQFEKHLIIICDDSSRNRPGRKKALEEVCQQENIRLVDCLSEHNNFYALPTRRSTNLLTDAIERIEKSLERNIKNIQPDYIFTHNPVGEYGHGSHRLLFEIVSQNEKVKNLLITNICQESNHRSSKEIPDIIWRAYCQHNLWSSKVYQLDVDFYRRCKVIYDKHNAWTWSKNPINRCRLHLLKEND